MWHKPRLRANDQHGRRAAFHLNTRSRRHKVHNPTAAWPRQDHALAEAIAGKLRTHGLHNNRPMQEIGARDGADSLGDLDV